MGLDGRAGVGGGRDKSRGGPAQRLSSPRLALRRPCRATRAADRKGLPRAAKGCQGPAKALPWGLWTGGRWPNATAECGSYCRTPLRSESKQLNVNWLCTRFALYIYTTLLPGKVCNQKIFCDPINTKNRKHSEIFGLLSPTRQCQIPKRKRKREKNDRLSPYFQRLSKWVNI